jgi:erythromycin esterase-like protein
MWRNQEMVEFISWLRDYNDKQGDFSKKVGFYGMDLYSLFESAHEVVKYLKEVDPEAAERARKRYACFERFYHDTQAYGYATAFGWCYLSFSM